MKEIKFSAKFLEIKKNRVNDYETRNRLLGNLAQVINGLKASRFRFYNTNRERLVLQMLLEDGNIETIYLSKPLTKMYNEQKFKVADILKLNVMETYYTTANGDENAILTLHRVADAITPNDFNETIEDIEELLTDIVNA